MRILRLAVVFFSFCAISSESTPAMCGHRKPIGWPWVARLLHEQSEKFFCSGTLISTKSVLSAASCFQPKLSLEVLAPAQVKVQLGVHSLSRLENLQLIRPRMIVIHPDWDPTDQDHYDADLGLVIFSDKVEITDSVSPICLSPLQREFNVNKEGTVVGWGFREFAASTTSEDTPREMNVKKMPDGVCAKEFKDLAKLSADSSKTFCASTVYETSSVACLGKTGSGLFTESGRKWSIDGIASTSTFNATGGERCEFVKQSLFTEVSRFINWIQKEWKTMSLQCDFRNGYIHGFTCKAQNLTILENGIFLTLREEGNQTQSGLNVLAVKIENQEIRFFPRNLGKLFPKLRVIKATESQLKVIRRAHFKNMPNVEVLDLLSNLLKTIATDTFMDLTNLKELDISRNKLKFLHHRLFFGNPNLVDIDASNNLIKSLHETLFKNNDKLNSIDFSNNLIEEVGFRFDERFTIVNFYLQNNTCFDQIFSIDAEHSFVAVNDLLVINCTASTIDADYLNLFKDLDFNDFIESA